MKLRQVFITAAICVGLPLGGNWTADTTKAKINFTVDGPFGTVHGSFSGLKTTIQFDEKDMSSSSMEASVDAKTVNTGIGLRNSDLRNKAEWLNTDKYPLISFKSKKIQKSEKGFVVQGDLTLKGTTKPVEIPFTFTGSGNTGVFKGQLIIKRTDFSLGTEGGSGGSLITITLEVPVHK
jgi:polyisoprenoid-binding protein YceI